MAGSTIALAHAPEGAGNATRMIAVAAALRERGRSVAIAGGGPGTDFARLNDFDPFVPADIDFISKRASGLGRALSTAAPQGARRFRDFQRWLDREDPAVVLSDDPFAIAAASVADVPFYRLDHAIVDDFDRLAERVMFRCFNGYCQRAGEAFIYTSLHEPSQTGRWDLHHVDPVAHVPPDPESVDPFDVLVIPGSYSNGFDRVADHLREDGHRVVVVGGPDWEPVPAMYPYAAEANAVLCTGFSSIAEAVVAGTPCVVHPFIDAQRGIAERITRYGVTGVRSVRSLEAAEAALREPGPSPEYRNGTTAVVEVLEGHLETGS